MCVALVVYVFSFTYSETLYLKRNRCTNVKYSYSVSKFCHDHQLKADGKLRLLWKTEERWILTLEWMPSQFHCYYIQGYRPFKIGKTIF